MQLSCTQQTCAHVRSEAVSNSADAIECVRLCSFHGHRLLVHRFEAAHLDLLHFCGFEPAAPGLWVPVALFFCTRPCITLGASGYRADAVVRCASNAL